MKRIRPETKSASPKPPDTAHHQPQQPPVIEISLPPRPDVSSSGDTSSRLPPDQYNSEHEATRSIGQKEQITAQAQSPRAHWPDEKRVEGMQTMPPPTIPSQTLSAQELRETAKQTLGRSERLEPRSHNGSAAPSPRRRSPSPITRPGTRDPSSDSRGSGGRSRSDRAVESLPEDKRQEKDMRSDSRTHSATVSRRDSLTHNRGDRAARERLRDSEKDRDGEREKDRDRGRDRHADRERDRERDRDRERARERDRERDRDRDRHRRDDKDRERDRKDRDDSGRNQPGAVPTPQDDRSLPTRPDPMRHRGAPSSEDGLGKRRRPIDDEVYDFLFRWFTRAYDVSSPTAVLNVVRERKVIVTTDRVGLQRRKRDERNVKHQRMTVAATRRRLVLLLYSRCESSLMVALACREAYTRRTFTEKYAR